MRIAIIGSVGVPGGYGGFETLADHLVQQHEAQAIEAELTVYCSAKAFSERPARYRRAALRYVGFDANGAQSILYDVLSLIDAVRSGHNVLLLLGVSGALALPLLRVFSRARIVVNIDGLEWKRDKWSRPARWLLKFSERLAVRFSHAVIADNLGIAEHVKRAYGVTAGVIEYGGDHAVALPPEDLPDLPDLPETYALALCRIEPENNIDMILEAYDRARAPLVFVGNWERSDYGRALRAVYANKPWITLMDPVYDPAMLQSIRRRASIYVHGHSAGGTNPALVEMMHFGVPVLAFDCIYNRYTTEGNADFFASTEELHALVAGGPDGRRPQGHRDQGDALREIARKRYNWATIAEKYYALLRVVARNGEPEMAYDR